ncbi:hypothetical protein EYF80_031108 [Liparis tanakae]|uniref:Uncharacterized protein n=1 Tax=Liparis tanakae TaxID=230148 RepID=A0A4Z2H1I7_9TELE|nr:hypothetical protein EYF80_031108 [Liparis tanakae]
MLLWMAVLQVAVAPGSVAPGSVAPLTLRRLKAYSRPGNIPLRMRLPEVRLWYGSMTDSRSRGVHCRSKSS